MKIDRRKLLKALVCVDAGLSSKDVIEQSSCYVLRGGRIWTFNDEVACSVELLEGFEEMECAIPSVPFKAILSKFDEELMDVELKEGEMLVKGGRRRAGIRVQKEILLPVSDVGWPESWSTLPEGFVEAIDAVQECAGKDESLFVLTCIHLHPRGIEASDNSQAIRYRIKTGLGSSVLVKRDDLVKVVELGVSEWGQTESWMHFKGADGLMASCRRWGERFPDIGPSLEVNGEETKLPKGLIDAAAKAKVFVDERLDVSSLTVALRGGKLRLRGEGPEGWYEEVQSSEYGGRPIEFRIAPRLLAEVCRRTDSCVVGRDKLKVTGERFVYISCLAAGSRETENE